jgi:hypothetical protein
MTPRLLVVCLGGLAGAGAVVCCDLDPGPEIEATSEDEAADEPLMETGADATEAIH